MAKLTFGILLSILCLLSVPVLASSGGRSGGGSFDRNESKPANPAPSSTREDSSRNYSEYNSYSTPSEPMSMTELVFVIVILLIGGSVAALNPKLLSSLTGGTPALPREVQNDRVTVSKIQIALYATARSVQDEIRQLSMAADFNTKEGLRHFLRESVLILQRNTDAWCYALGNSQPYDRNTAKEKFDLLSTTERVKFSAETFSRMANQRMIKKDYQNEAEVPEFIIVTLLIGTENDKPLFSPIKNRDDVKNALTACLAMTSTYLLTVELLWTPESDRDSLTQDDLIVGYTDLIAL